jgi:undecaprenyl diphosphate synthase
MPLRKNKPASSGTTPDEALIDKEKLPRHIAIIMDGNGRWAKQHGFTSRIRGHRAGIKAVRTTVESAAELGIKVLSLYAFSKENWQRPKREVSTLMHLLSRYIDVELKRLTKNDIRLVVSGEMKDLPEFVREKLRNAIRATGKNKHMALNLCLSYGARDEIIKAVRNIARQVQKEEIKPSQVTAKLFSQYLYHPELGDPDLLIRTSGEMRVSNFLLWQIAYAELYVTPVLWPDFRREHLVEAILAYQQRERRFGGVIER